MADFQQNSQTNSHLDNQHHAKSHATTGLSQTALDVVLVILETLFTLLLRFDAPLRQIMYPLAKDNTTVCVRSYVPHITIYATFTVNGVLLDSQQPNKAVDVTINGFTWEIVQAIFSQKVNAVEKLQFLGEIEKVAQVKAFLLAVGVTKVIQEILQKFTGKAQKQDDKPKKSIKDYQEKIETQKQQMNELTIKNAEVETALLELKSQNKILKISLGIVIALFVISVIVILMN